MSFTVELKGIKVTCDGTSDVLALIDAASSIENHAEQPKADARPQNGHLLNGAPTKKPTRARGRVQRTSVAQAIRFLEAIPEEPGISSPELARKLELEDSRGLGGLSVGIKAFLRKRNLQWQEVWNLSGSMRGKKWVAGERMAEAIAILNSELSEEDA